MELGDSNGTSAGQHGSPLLPAVSRRVVLIHGIGALALRGEPTENIDTIPG